MKFFKTRREIQLKAFQRGYQKGVEMTKREKDLQIRILKKNMENILETKTKEIMKRDNRIISIEKTLEDFIHLFSRAKHMAYRIEDKEETKYQRISEEYAETNGFANRLIHLCTSFERKVPKLKAKIEQYKIENIVK